MIDPPPPATPPPATPGLPGVPPSSRAGGPPTSRFDEIAGGYAARPGVSYGQIWHNDGLKVNGKIFAMMVRGALVVKVPAAQARTLVETGTGEPFEPRPGRAMREWVVLGDDADWASLVADAFGYVSSLS